MPILEYIDKVIENPDLTVGMLAEKIFVSEVYLRKLFRRAIGLSPVSFIQRRRIERACMLFKGGEMSVKQIAEACGFMDVPFFYLVFKQWSGTTPARYRD